MQSEQTAYTDGCRQCPRQCGADRADRGTVGFCQAPETFRVAKCSLHPFEEPCIAGATGAGTVFFCGCNLRCVYCQNREISRFENRGEALTCAELTDRIHALVREGAACVELVTPTHYTLQLVPVLRELRKTVHVPIVWNSGGYESPDVLRKLEGAVDVYLPDCKYRSDELALRLSHAPNYFSVACEAIREMLRQVGDPTFDENGILRRGVLVRHLILPGHRQDSIALLRALEREFGSDAFLLSLMSQYTPDFAPPDSEKSLHRRLTAFEYDSVHEEALRLGFSGYAQGRSSATAAYTPDWTDS